MVRTGAVEKFLARIWWFYGLKVIDREREREKYFQGYINIYHIFKITGLPNLPDLNH